MNQPQANIQEDGYLTVEKNSPNKNGRLELHDDEYYTPLGTPSRRKVTDTVIEEETTQNVIISI